MRCSTKMFHEIYNDNGHDGVNGFDKDLYDKDYPDYFIDAVIFSKLCVCNPIACPSKRAHSFKLYSRII